MTDPVPHPKSDISAEPESSESADFLTSESGLTHNVTPTPSPDGAAPTHRILEDHPSAKREGEARSGSHFPEHLLTEEGLRKFEEEQQLGVDPLGEPSDYVGGVPRNYVHLSAQDPTTWKKPDDVSWGDHIMKPNRPLTARHKELARLIFLGKSTSEISERMGFGPARVSSLRSNTKIMKEVERLSERAFQSTINERLKDLGPAAMDVIEEVLNSDDDAIKPALKVELARWTVEKLTGKPRQEVDHQSSTLSNFMTMIEEMRQAGTVFEVPERDVTPKALPAGEDNGATVSGTEATGVTESKPEERDLRNWVKENL